MPSPGTLALRAYLDADWPALCDIHDRSRPLELAAAGLSEAFLTLAQTAQGEGLFDGKVLVAEREGRVLGFAAHAQGELTWLYTDPDHQRQGVARALLRQVIADCDGSLSTEVLVGNDAALALYLAEGFSIQERVDGRLAGNEQFAASGFVLVRASDAPDSGAER